MSNALAIASVSAVLKDLLNNAAIDHQLSNVVGEVKVSALPPDRVLVEGTPETSRINLFMYQVTPNQGWRNVDLQARLAVATGLPVHVENSGRACALAQMWETRNVAARVRNLVFVSVSDGIGVGVVVNGELLRGRHNIAGEFAHMPLSIDGPRCSCGAIGCWEAYISNLATLTRYFDRAPHVTAAGDQPFTIDDLIARARTGDRKAVDALQASARYLGLGLAGVVNIIDPDCVFIGGEITTAWDLIEGTVRTALAGRALTPAAASTDIVIVSAEEHSRLRGAAMLVAAPTFAAPVVA
jgi:predicted NBD/HSP70 family sugar kinase